MIQRGLKMAEIEEVKIEPISNKAILNKLYIVYCMGFVNAFSLSMIVLMARYEMYFLLVCFALIFVTTFPPTGNQIKTRNLKRFLK